MAATASSDGFAGGGAGFGQDRQRQQQPEQDRKAGELPMVGIADRPGPCELRIARGIEHAPIGADAAFVGLPGLIERFDDVVVDAVGFGARRRNRAAPSPARSGRESALVHVVAGARPAELGDHDALAGMGAAQLVVGVDGLVDRLR